ncbi:MAG: hypothetical protein U0263_33345 [Polyangiaceae bacterium]
MSETSEFSRITGLDPGAAELWLVQLASVEVFSTAGERVRLAQRFRERVTVTGFLRHFGCLFCHQMVADLDSRGGSPSDRARRVCSSSAMAASTKPAASSKTRDCHAPEPKS